MIIAVDFDGTLCYHRYPDIGEAKSWVIDELKKKIVEGHKIILWTCRDGIMLDKAVAWCKDWGVVFDAVNEDLPEIKDSFKYKSCKVYADVYLDDRNIITLTEI